MLPNGDLVLEGVREIEINGDRQIVVLTGVVRPATSGRATSCRRPSIGQMRIRYFGRGLIKDNLKPGLADSRAQQGFLRSIQRVVTASATRSVARCACAVLRCVAAIAAPRRRRAACVKDVASLQGAAPTPLIGYGLVVGLNKTGDRRQTIFSAQTLANMLERFGVWSPARDQDRERRRRDGDGGAAAVTRGRRPRSTSPPRRLATRAACRAAC